MRCRITASPYGTVHGILQEIRAGKDRTRLELDSAELHLLFLVASVTPRPGSADCRMSSSRSHLSNHRKAVHIRCLWGADRDAYVYGILHGKSNHICDDLKVGKDMMLQIHNEGGAVANIAKMTFKLS